MVGARRDGRAQLGVSLSSSADDGKLEFRARPKERRNSILASAFGRIEDTHRGSCINAEGGGLNFALDWKNRVSRFLRASLDAATIHADRVHLAL